MKFSEYITRHHVFTTTELLRSADSEMAAKQQLKSALASGVVERVRRGLYVSYAGKFEGLEADPYEIVVSLDSCAVLSYHSALEALGVAHNIGFECHFRTEVVKSPFSFKGIEYLPHAADEDILTQRIRGRAFGSALVTNREQTIIDCLKHPERSGGIEEVIKSLSALPYIDASLVAQLALADSASMGARVGWLLDAKKEQWRVSENVILNLLAESRGVVSKLDKNATVSRGWSAKWNMRLPEEVEEVESWVS